MWLIFQYVTKSWSKHLFVGITRDPVTYWQMPVTYSKSLPPQQCQLLEAHSAYLTSTHTLFFQLSRHLILKENNSEVLNDIQQSQKTLWEDWGRNFAREFFHFSECTSVWEFLDARENESGLECELPYSFLFSTGLFSASVPFPRLKCIHIWLGSCFLVWSMLNEWFIFLNQLSTNPVPQSILLVNSATQPSKVQASEKSWMDPIATNCNDFRMC